MVGLCVLLLLVCVFCVAGCFSLILVLWFWFDVRLLGFVVGLQFGLFAAGCFCLLIWLVLVNFAV